MGAGQQDSHVNRRMYRWLVIVAWERTWDLPDLITSNWRERQIFGSRLRHLVLRIPMSCLREVRSESWLLTPLSCVHYLRPWPTAREIQIESVLGLLAASGSSSLAAVAVCEMNQ